MAATLVEWMSNMLIDYRHVPDKTYSDVTYSKDLNIGSFRVFYALAVSLVQIKLRNDFM